jgi:hypothetical protein
MACLRTWSMSGRSPVLHRLAHGRAHFQGVHVTADADKLFTQAFVAGAPSTRRALQPLLTITNCA